MPRRKGPPDCSKEFGPKSVMIVFRISQREADWLDKAVEHVGAANRSVYMRHAVLAHTEEILKRPSHAENVAAYDKANRRRYAEIASAAIQLPPPPLPEHLRGLGHIPSATTRSAPSQAVVSPPTPIQLPPPPKVETPSAHDLLPPQTASLLDMLGIPMYAAEVAKGGPMELPLPDDMDDWA